ncbi:MAG: hypothetical protein DWH79_10835 [Planctomycetota bacterium]|nr:MAG: hypothetical protein DWH79_10835 [Planctomycetota bacterium]
MSERVFRSLDESLERRLAGVEMRQYEARLSELLYWDQRDPCDVSILPLVLTAERHAAYEQAAERICRAALDAFVERRHAERFLGDSLQQLVQGFPLRQGVISGNARFDFLEQGDDIRLVEMNFVGVGTVGHSLQATRALMDIVPELGERYRLLHPTDAFREQLLRQGISTIALLTKDNDREFYGSWLDRVIIAEGVKPVEMIIVPRAEWPEFTSDGAGLLFRGRKIDAIYPRELTWQDSMRAGADWCRFFLSSGAFCFDHWSLILVEDKDLRFLARIDPAAEAYLPRTIDLEALPAGADASGMVLKRKHEHGGEGVWMSPVELPQEHRGEYLLQERVAMNQTRVRSLMGFEGVVSYDVAAHVNYDYDLESRTLLRCRVSGYLSRYAPRGDIVNISKGGGVIPVLVERSET